MISIIRKSIGALMLVIAVYLGYQDIFSSEDISGMYFKRTVLLKISTFFFNPQGHSNDLHLVEE